MRWGSGALGLAIALLGALIGCQPDGMRVSELLAARDTGELGSRQVRLSGYWSDRSFGHSCAPARAVLGDLEIYCHDGEFGITEWNEPIAQLTPDFRLLPAEGPHLTPWLTDEQWRRLGGPHRPPTRITVLGHFDDPRATDCQPEAVERCRERFVIDEIVELQP